MDDKFYHDPAHCGPHFHSGPPGKRGTPGVSPTVQISELSEDGAYTITVTDAYHSESVRIPVADTDFIAERIDMWMDAHPEATTTVEEGSITAKELAEELREAIYAKVGLDDLAPGVADELKEIPDESIGIEKLANATIEELTTIPDNSISFEQLDPEVVLSLYDVPDGSITKDKLASSLLDMTLTEVGLPADADAVGRLTKSLIGRLKIANLSDLNDYTTVGNYYFPTYSTIFSYLSHTPTKDNQTQLRILTVEQPNPTSDDLLQTAVCDGGYPVYSRRRVSGTWETVWRTVIPKTDAFQRPPIDADTVAAMFDVIETYAAQAFTSDGQDSNLVYEHSKGPYVTDLGTNSATGQYSICCAQFVNAVINAIPWRNSRYENGADSKNTRLPWGYQYDDLVGFRASNNDPVRLTERYLTSPRIAEYGAAHGFLAENDGVFQPMPGDVFCIATSSDDVDYRHIGHVGIVMSCDSVANGNGDIQVVEAWPAKKTDSDGTEHDCGLRMNLYNRSEIDCFVRFPLSGGKSETPQKIKTVTTFSSFSTDKKLYVASSSDRSNLLNTPGFYTVVAKYSNFPVDDEEHYLRAGFRYVDETSSRTVRFSRYGHYFWGLIYLERPIGTLFQLYADDNTASATPEEVKIYRGYYPLTV